VATKRQTAGSKGASTRKRAGTSGARSDPRRPRAPDTGSGRPLAEKLGLAPGMRGAVLGAPSGYVASLAGAGASLGAALAADLSFVQLFVTRRAELEAALPDALASLTERGALWVSWPKRSSGVATDLTEDVIREVALPLGIVDVKVCAVDVVWSGLKLVRRLRQKV
jgi:hypothetical protein